MMKGKAWVALIMATALVCSTAFVASAAQAGGTLVFASGNDAVRLDPADVTDGESIQRVDNMFESLVEFNYCKEPRIKPNQFRNKSVYFSNSIIKKNMIP